MEKPEVRGMDEERLLEYITAMVAIAVIGVLAYTGRLDTREAVNLILAIVGYVLGKGAAVKAYRSYRVRRARGYPA